MLVTGAGALFSSIKLRISVYTWLDGVLTPVPIVSSVVVERLRLEPISAYTWSAGVVEPIHFTGAGALFSSIRLRISGCTWPDDVLIPAPVVPSVVVERQRLDPISAYT